MNFFAVCGRLKFELKETEFLSRDSRFVDHAIGKFELVMIEFQLAMHKYCLGCAQIVFFLDKNHQVHPVSKFRHEGDFLYLQVECNFNFTDCVINKTVSHDKNSVASSSNFKRPQMPKKLWVLRSTGKSSMQHLGLLLLFIIF